MITRRILFATGAATALFALAALPGFAEDAGLYAAPPPPDAAFVRLLNADTSADATLNVAGVTLSAAAGGLSAYSFVTKGDYAAAIPGGSLTVSFAPQKFYTVLLNPAGQNSVIEDNPVTNPVHAGLYFYNLSAAPLALEATVGKTQAAVFKDVAPGQAAWREVNAFDVTFAVSNGGEASVALPAISLVRQQGVSIVALQQGDKLTAFQVVNAVATN